MHRGVVVVDLENNQSRKLSIAKHRSVPRKVSCSSSGCIAELEDGFRKLSIAQNRSVSSQASTLPFSRRQISHGHPRRQRTISHQVPSVNRGLPSPPDSDSDAPHVPGETHVGTVRGVLPSHPQSRLSSCASLFHSPPSTDSESDEVGASSKYKENNPAPGTLRRRRPLLFTFPDGPADEGGQKSDTPVKIIEKCQQFAPPDFPLQPVPTIIADHFPAVGAECGSKVKRKDVTSIIQHRTPSSTPDRFISSRGASQDATRRFNLNKRAYELSSSERLLRNNSASPDPFESPTAARVGRRHFSTNVQSSNRSASRTGSGTNLLNLFGSSSNAQGRQVSTGAVWNVGGSSATTPLGPINSIPNGHGGYVGSSTNAPIYTSRIFERESPDLGRGPLERRVAAALDIDTTTRVFNRSQSPKRGRTRHRGPGSSSSRSRHPQSRPRWQNEQWFIEGSSSLLDAPLLRDDYYCSVLAYCGTSRTLAVGLSNRVYLWSEGAGVQYPALREVDRRNTYVSSLSFSSEAGGNSILAMGRNDGHLSLWSINEEGIKFGLQQASAVACVSFKPVTTRRPSVRFDHVLETEELLVGDELGNVYYYAVEWMTDHQVAIHGWKGNMTLLAKISVHAQQVCGLAWSPDGQYFATGANDNACCLFEVRDIVEELLSHDEDLPAPKKTLETIMASFGLTEPNSTSQHGPSTLPSHGDRSFRHSYDSQNSSLLSVRPGLVFKQTAHLEISEGRQKHTWLHSAAIKAIAFCPWQRGLIATGGGSNDRAIHFYHTFSGACLATIDVQAQVTSLIWSTSRREIAATFGYAQPDHPYRIAVFSWPDCRQVVAIPWANDMRALLAIAYPGGPNETSRQAGEGKAWWSRTAEEGCIVVASSDESVKFHEIWTGSRKSTGGSTGLLGGSDILEGLEGIDKEGVEVIR